MKVSVVIPAYEAGTLLLDALESVRVQQGFTPGVDLQAVVANDGASRADSLQALDLVRQMSWVKLVDTTGRTGPAGARNLAAAHATGEWLAFLDADDLFAPDALQRRLRLALANPDVGCVATDYAEFPASAPFDPRGLVGVIATTPSRRIAVQQAFDLRRQQLLDRPLQAFLGTVPFWTGSVLIRKASFDRLGGFPSGHFIGEDIHLWLRIAATEQIIFDPEITAYCRKGHASLTAGESAMNLKTARCYEHLAKDRLMQPVMQQLRGLISDAFRDEAYAARAQQRVFRSVAMAFRALRWRPSSGDAWRALLLAAFRVRARE
jgi:glycosyltransferase involved in cell wall biosynthesis